MNKEKWFIKNGIILTVLSAIIALTSALKEVVFANYFGVSEQADAYTIALLLPETLFAVVWNALNAILVPKYSEVLYNQGKERARQFIRVFFTAVCVITLSFVLLSEGIADLWVYLFAPGFTPEMHTLTVQLVRWLFPMLFFEGIMRVCAGIMQVNNIFSVSKALVMIRNVGVSVFLFAFSYRFGIFAAAYGLLTGVIIETVISWIYTRKFESLRPNWNFKDPDLLQAGKQAIPIIIGAGVNEINLLADKMTASFLDAGSMAALNYASKLEVIITTTILVNAVSIVFPAISEHVAKGETSEVSRIYERTVKLILLLSIPIAMGGAVLGGDIIRVAFARGAFDEAAALIVSPLFSVYLFAAVFGTVRNTTVNVFAAYGRTKAIMNNTIISVIINVALNILLSWLLGAIGLALATCIAVVTANFLLMQKVSKELFPVNFKGILLLFAKSLIAAAVMVAAVWLTRTTFISLFGMDTTLQQVIGIGLGVIAGVIVYAACLIALRTGEFKALLKLVLNRRG